MEHNDIVLSLYDSFLEELQSENNLLSISNCESKTCAFGMEVAQKTKSVTLFQSEDIYIECHSSSPFYSLEKKVIQTNNTIKITINGKTEEYSVSDYLKVHSCLPEKTEKGKRKLLPFLIEENTIVSSKKEKDNLFFELNKEGCKEYQDEIIENGDFDSVDFQSCKIKIDIHSKEIVIDSLYKIKNGFLNFKMNETNSISFKPIIDKIDIENENLDLASCFKEEIS